MKIFRMDNTEGFTEEQLDKMNNLYKKQAVLLDSTSDNYDHEIKNLQEKIINNFYE